MIQLKFNAVFAQDFLRGLMGKEVRTYKFIYPAFLFPEAFKNPLQAYVKHLN